MKKGLAAMNCNVAIMWMHDYLDGDLSLADTTELKAHLQQCTACQDRYQQLDHTEAAAYRVFTAHSAAAQYDSEASKDLTNRIMAQLPSKKSKQRAGIVKYIYRYPGITAVAIFLLVMFGSFFMSWQENTELIVAGQDLNQLVIEGDTVIVPEGAHLTGNLTIENGKAIVRGEVDGNVTVIDGTLNLASTGYIAGQSKTIDQALDWFWYKVTLAFGGLSD